MLIGLLLAGQHTSSTTSAWLGFFIARDKSIQEQCYAEQKAVCGDDLPPLTYDQVCMFIIPEGYCYTCRFSLKKVKYSHVLCVRIVICKKQLVIGDILANSAVSIWVTFQSDAIFYQHWLRKLHLLQPLFKKFAAWSCWKIIISPLRNWMWCDLS